MPDISKCSGINCLKRLKCHRYTATPSKCWQSYGVFEPKDCEYFWDNEGYEDEGRTEEEIKIILDSIDGKREKM